MRISAQVYVFLHISALIVSDRLPDLHKNRNRGPLAVLSSPIPDPADQLQQTLGKYLSKLDLRHSRRASGVCNANSCCDSDYFCQADVFLCMPCSDCQYDSDSIENACVNRCSQAQSSDFQYPRLLWLYLSSNRIDASHGRQFVDLKFAVQDDSGMQQAKVMKDTNRVFFSFNDGVSHSSLFNQIHVPRDFTH